MIRPTGYKSVMLTKPKKLCYVHRLVALAFIPCPGNPENYDVDHIDGNPSNNDVRNLQWLTHGDNMRKAAKGEKWRNAIRRRKDTGRQISARDIASGKVVQRFPSIITASRWLCNIIAAKGGCPNKAERMSPNIFKALNTHKIAYGFRWTDLGKYGLWLPQKPRPKPRRRITKLDAYEQSL